MHAGKPMQDERERALCGAKTRAGGRCQNAPVTGSRRCRMHGGATPVGIASPHFRDGRHTDKLPKRLNEAYARSLADPDLLALNSEIALVDSRLADVLGRVDSGEAGRLWAELRDCWERFKLAQALKDRAAMQIELTAIDRVLGRGASDAAAWGEIGDLIERRRRLIETEQKRRVAMQQMVTVDRLELLLSHLVRIIQENVTDRAALARISAGIAAVVSGPPA